MGRKKDVAYIRVAIWFIRRASLSASYAKAKAVGVADKNRVDNLSP